jgi:cytochrome c biogenesis protein CcdA/glutaredoxin
MLFLIILSPLYPLITIYYGRGCPHCAKTLALLKEKNISFIAKEVYYNITNREELKKLYEKFNFPLDQGGVPTILVETKNKSYLIIGELDESFYKEALNCSFCENGKVYSSFEIYQKVKTNENKNLNKQENIQNNNSSKNPNKEKLILLTIILAALIDSINPCVLAIMAMLLINLIRQETKRKAVIAGLIFTSTVTFIYFLMGLGIIKALSIMSIQKVIYYILLILAIIFTILEFNAYFNYKPGFLSVEMPMFLRPLAKKLIKATTSLVFVFITAVILSLFLVPCSSGPYLLILGMIASQNLMEKTLGIIYLVIYNIIFSFPMLIITLLVAFGIKPEKIKEFRDKNVRKLHLFSGILMALITLLLLIQIFYFS